MQRALLAGVILALLFAVLGVFVVLKRMAFFASGIAHASLGGVAIGIIAAVNPLFAALVFAVLVAVAIYLLEKRFDISSDTAIGILFTAGMSLGVVLISTQQGYQPELISFLFGNILAISQMELYLMTGASVVIVALLLKNYQKLALISLDKDTAKVAGLQVERWELVFNIILAVAVVLGIKVLGVVLVSALLVIPIAISKMLSKSFKKLMISSVVVSELVVLIGIFLSYHWDLPTGPVIVLFGTVLLGVVALLKR